LLLLDSADFKYMDVLHNPKLDDSENMMLEATSKYCGQLCGLWLWRSLLWQAVHKAFNARVVSALTWLLQLAQGPSQAKGTLN
jgi:hypothetical protein